MTLRGLPAFPTRSPPREQGGLGRSQRFRQILHALACEDLLRSADAELLKRLVVELPDRLDPWPRGDREGCERTLAMRWSLVAGAPWPGCPPGPGVGTRSLRRMALLRMLRPDLELVAMGGNIDTRIGYMACRQGEAAASTPCGTCRHRAPDDQRLARTNSRASLLKASHRL